MAPSGLDVAAVIAHKRETGSVVGTPHTQTITNEELLELECDILIPAALENQSRSDNVGRVNTKLVVEAANGPTTPAADKHLFERGVVVIPDILANAGGVTVSYFEWVQNIQAYGWDEERVNRELHKRMNHAYADLKAQARSTGARDLRSAAFQLAVNRVAAATILRS